MSSWRRKTWWRQARKPAGPNMRLQCQDFQMSLFKVVKQENTHIVAVIHIFSSLVHRRTPCLTHIRHLQSHAHANSYNFPTHYHFWGHTAPVVWSDKKPLYTLFKHTLFRHTLLRHRGVKMQQVASSYGCKELHHTNHLLQSASVCLCVLNHVAWKTEMFALFVPCIKSKLNQRSVCYCRTRGNKYLVYLCYGLILPHCELPVVAR